MSSAPPSTPVGAAAQSPAVEYLVFDVESVADARLVAKLRYPELSLEPAEAVKRYRAELLAANGTDFIPYTYQLPIAIVVAKVSKDYRLLDLVSLDEPHFRPHVLTERFWRGWDVYKEPTLVSFNGRTFDVPLLELAAFRYGIALASWFKVNAKTYDQPRNRYNIDAHLDLNDVLTNFGASRFSGGLNLAANLLGKPGKIDVKGHMVQDLYEAGRLGEISDYCRCDVLDTYFVFLRTAVVLGQLTLEDEQQRVADAKQWVVDRATNSEAFQLYLNHWGDWQNPWQRAQSPTP
jgi:predicted PolB exonuclease-like 3'-5' exonuclease